MSCADPGPLGLFLRGEMRVMGREVRADASAPLPKPLPSVIDEHMNNRVFFAYLRFGSKMALSLIPTAYFLAITAASAEPPKYVPNGFSLQWRADFTDKKVLERLEFSDPQAWRLSKAKGKPALELSGSSRYSYKVRSPSSIALLKTRKFGDFLFEAELLQTGRDYGHRDLCLFFGFQDPGHYYYAHFASKTDSQANQIFMVDEKPFTKISTKTTKGSKWGRDKWHKVRVQRIGTKISVWFDDMTTPAMLADDKSFGTGYVGFGSYNDTGMFASARIWAPTAKKVEEARKIFPRPSKK